MSISSSGSHPQVDTVLKKRHFGLTFRQRGRVPKASHYVYTVSFRKQKQQEAKVKVRETDPTWSQFFTVT